jgi:hypothetical protein
VLSGEGHPLSSESMPFHLHLLLKLFLESDQCTPFTVEASNLLPTLGVEGRLTEVVLLLLKCKAALITLNHGA